MSLAVSIVRNVAKNIPRMIVSILLTVILVHPDGIATSRSERKIPCKIPANAASCYWTHGRLTYGNGTPAVRLWKIGTHRLLGIYSGPSVDRWSLDNENPEFPENLRKKLDWPGTVIYADFEVCPLEKERRGWMQAACIESAKNILAKKYDDK